MRKGIIITCLLFIACQPGISEEEKIKTSFLTSIDPIISRIKSDDRRFCAPSTASSGFFGAYIRYKEGFEYDIRKTDSLISPYVATVMLKFDIYETNGSTQEACLSDAGSTSKQHSEDYFFAYQDGKWIAKGSKPNY